MGDINELVQSLKKMGIEVPNSFIPSHEEAERVRKGEVTDEELIECLASPYRFVVTNATIQILKRKLTDPRIVEKLTELSKYKEKRYELKIYGFPTMGHFADGCLYLMNTEESLAKYHEIADEMGDEDKQKIEAAIEALRYMTKSVNA